MTIKINDVYLIVHKNKTIVASLPNKEEAERYLKEDLVTYFNPDYVKDCSAVLIHDWLEATNPEHKLEEFLEKRFGGEVEAVSFFEDGVGIVIEGDWKHSHGSLSYIMDSIFNMEEIKQEVIGDPVDDYYAAKHLFAPK